MVNADNVSVRKKAQFPKELLNESIQNNTEKWMQEYFLSKNIERGYRDKLRNFFRYIRYEDKPFNKFTRSDVAEFIEVLNENDYKLDGINPYLSAIRMFKEYLIEKHPTIFPYYFLKDLKGETHYSETKDKGIPLPLKVISYIRHYNKKNFKTHYMFELVYQLGIQKLEIEECLPELADFNVKAFKNSDVSFKNTPSIENLIRKALNIDNFKVTYNMFSDHMNKLSQHLLTNGIYDKQIFHNTILNTHRAYFFACPNCREVFENISDNWVLAKTELDDDFRLVCFHCKGVSN